MIRTAVAGCLAATAALLVAAPPTGAEPRELPAVVPGVVAVRFREPASGGAPRRDWTTPSGASVRLEPLLPATATARGAAPPAPRRPGALDDPDDAVHEWLRLPLPPGADPGAAARELAAAPGVAEAVPIRLIPLLDAAALPADPELSGQWQHEAIGAPAAWAAANGDGVVIAIVDTGIDAAQEDLAPNLWTNAAEADGAPGVDDDGNGFVDDVHGYDFTDVPEIVGAGDYRDRDADPNDDVGHGTWVAGAAAARGDNGVGGAGVAWGARIMALRAGFQPGVGFSLGFLAEDDAAAAIVYAVDNGADIVNLSFGDVVRSPILEMAVRYAVDRGVVVVAASGNSGDGVPFHPASLAGVLAVGASTREGMRAGFSAFGPNVRLLAPGSGILTTDVGGGVTSKSGTSLASPVAAGALAILKQVHPDWSAARLIEALYASSLDPAPPLDPAHGGRRLRVDAALGLAGDAEIRFDLDEGSAIDAVRVIRGGVFGRGVRGWRVRVRPADVPDWRTLRAEPRRPAYDEELATWHAAGDAEGEWLVRVEALGLDRVLATRERRVRVDHSAPVLTGIEAVPVLSLDPVTGAAGYGVRVVATADEPVFGRLTLAPAAGGPPITATAIPRFERALSSTHPVVGVDQPLPPGEWRAELSWANDAGLVGTATLDVTIPPIDAERPVRGGAPDAATYLPGLVDLDGDGRPELVGESRLRTGAFYGNLRAWSATTGFAPFEEAWRSDERGIPRDAGDFDGDGRPDLLVLSLQKATVLGARQPGAFPTVKLAEINDGWAATFVPAASGTGLDVVTSFNNAIRIWRRQNGGAILDQELVNAGNGINSIAPSIVRLADGAGGTGLATVDGDGDLLVARRGQDGRFAWAQSLPLGAGALSAIAAADLDGDGRSEIAVIEAVGQVPSPTAGLRDGFYRLIVFRAGAGGDFAAWRRLAFTGQFPGNPVHLHGGIPREGTAGAENLWVTIAGRAWRLADDGQGLVVERLVEAVGDGPLATGRIGDEPAVRWLVFPTAAGVTPPDGDLGSATVIGPWGETIAPGGAVIGLAARHLGTGPDGDLIRLDWSGGPVTGVRRLPPDTPGPAQVWTLAPGASSLVDSTAVRGATYRYRLYTAITEKASLVVANEPSNPVTAAAWDGRRIVVDWARPIRSRESARLSVVPLADGVPGDPIDEAVTSSLLSADGRRLVVEMSPELADGRQYRLLVDGFVSEGNLALTGADARIDFTTVSSGNGPLRLVRVVPVDAVRLEVTLAPAAPAEPVPADFELLDGPAISAVERIGEERVRLTLAFAPRGADQRLRLRPSAVGPGGEPVVAGEADVLPFRLRPVAYPNPARPGSGEVRFDWLPVGDRVTILDLAGRDVWSGEAGSSGMIEWPLVGADGTAVAPGTYLWRIESDPGFLGKLAVIR